jgi:hypothetical protein
MNSMHSRVRLALRQTQLLVFAACLSACSPGLDWREVRPAESGMVLMFPCKPEVYSRPATPSEPVRMGMAQCKADGITFSLSWAEVRDPALVNPALREMRDALRSKLGAGGAAPAASQALQVPGMTPNPEASQVHLGGLAGSGAAEADIAVFTRGVWVYQAVMLAPKRQPAAWDNFINSMKLET